jgi:hypothetical protein
MNAPGAALDGSDQATPTGDDKTSRWHDRVQRIVQFRTLVSPLVQRVLLIVAALFLLAGLALSIKTHPQALLQASWPPLLFALAINVPLGLGLAVVEFVGSARLIGKSISIRYAVFTVVTGSAANMLPLPGAFMARMASLKGVGARYRDGAIATMVANLVWVSLALLWSGAWMFAFNAEVLALLMIGGGAVFGIVCLIAAKWLGAKLQDLLLVAVTRLALFSNQSIRLLLCLMAIHVGAEFAQAAVLSLSALVGSAMSLVPAGLGIREGVAAALGPVIGLTAAAGFLAAFINRILGLVVLVPAALLLAWHRPRAEQGTYN